MLFVLLYAAMAGLLGIEHYLDLRAATPPISRRYAVTAAAIAGVLWFPHELVGAIGRLWRRA